MEKVVLEHQQLVPLLLVIKVLVEEQILLLLKIGMVQVGQKQQILTLLEEQRRVLDHNLQV